MFTVFFHHRNPFFGNQDPRDRVNGLRRRFCPDRETSHCSFDRPDGLSRSDADGCWGGCCGSFERCGCMRGYGGDHRDRFDRFSACVGSDRVSDGGVFAPGHWGRGGGWSWHGPGGGDFMGGCGGRGGGFRGGPKVRRGDVRTALLLLLAEQSRNGYQLMQEIEQRSNGAWRPSPGSTYPALQQMEDEELVAAEQDGGCRVYRLTEKGRKVASEKAASGEPVPWDPANFGDDSGFGIRDTFQQLVMAARQVQQVGTPSQIASVHRILGDACKSMYQILVDSSPVQSEHRDH